MRAFNHHPLSKITVKEKLLGGLSWAQTGWVLLGLYLSSKMAEVVPVLPFLENYKLLKFLPYGIPLFICVVLGFVEHQSGLSILQYFTSYLGYKSRKTTKLDCN